MTQQAGYDCIVGGSCVVDILCRPVPLDRPIGGGVLHPAEPLILTGGGITCNSGITLARLGMRVGVLSYVGNDAWGPILRKLIRDAGVDDSLLTPHPTQATSTTVVAVDPSGERSFFHNVGAPARLNARAILDRLDVFRQTRFFLLGYYSLLPDLEADLPHVFEQIRAAGCKTALDAAGAGGRMQPLDRILPHLDLYMPSLAEAQHQTGLEDPCRIIQTYRDCGAPGVLGVKLGKKGVLLSGAAGEYLEIPAVAPPGPVVDTTGAGDSFYAGLIAGLIRGLPLRDAGRLGAAAGACCVTALGGWAGARDYAETVRLAGLA
ncbi:MAG TPA: carbohydrate kinase family protein [Phycisphaeraceae bacterium]